MAIDYIQGTDNQADWYLKANELINAVNTLVDAGIPELQGPLPLDDRARILTNALIAAVNDLNQRHPVTGARKGG